MNTQRTPLLSCYSASRPPISHQLFIAIWAARLWGRANEHPALIPGLVPAPQAGDGMDSGEETHYGAVGEEEEEAASGRGGRAQPSSPITITRGDTWIGDI